jgi:hypothetical protein
VDWKPCSQKSSMAVITIRWRVAAFMTGLNDQSS